MSRCEIVRPRQAKRHVERRLEYPDFSFPLTDGQVIPVMRVGTEEVPVSQEECIWWNNYLMCLEKYGEGEAVTLEWDYVEPALAKCSCGTELLLECQYAGACQCPDCGQWYNVYGQALVDPEYWEEDDEDDDGYDYGYDFGCDY